MGLLPAEYTARCTETDCSFNVSANSARYRDHLAKQHATRYGHTVDVLDLT